MSDDSADGQKTLQVRVRTTHPRIERRETQHPESERETMINETKIVTTHSALTLTPSELETVVTGSEPIDLGGHKDAVKSVQQGADSSVFRRMYRTSRQSEPSVLKEHLDEALVSLLSQTERSAIEQILDGDHDLPHTDANNSPKRVLEQLLHEENLAALPAEQRALCLQICAHNPKDVVSMKSLLAVLKSGVLPTLLGAEQKKMILTFAKLQTTQRVRLAQLTARFAKDEQPLALRDHLGYACLDRLYTLAAGLEIHRDLQQRGLTPASVALECLELLTAPGRIFMLRGPLEWVAIAKYALAITNPAELLRIWSAWLSPQAWVQMRSGIKISIQPAHTRAEEVLDEGLQQLFMATAKTSPPNTQTPTLSLQNLCLALGELLGHKYRTVEINAQNRAIECDALPSTPSPLAPCFLVLNYPVKERICLLGPRKSNAVYLRGPLGLDPSEELTLPPRPNRISNLDEGIYWITPEELAQKIVAIVQA